jgi:hypothetical protein
MAQASTNFIIAQPNTVQVWHTLTSCKHQHAYATQVVPDKAEFSCCQLVADLCLQWDRLRVALNVYASPVAGLGAVPQLSEALVKWKGAIFGAWGNPQPQQVTALVNVLQMNGKMRQQQQH